MRGQGHPSLTSIPASCPDPLGDLHPTTHGPGTPQDWSRSAALQRPRKFPTWPGAPALCPGRGDYHIPGIPAGQPGEGPALGTGVIEGYRETEPAGSTPRSIPVHQVSLPGCAGAPGHHLCLMQATGQRGDTRHRKPPGSFRSAARGRLGSAGSWRGPGRGEARPGTQDAEDRPRVCEFQGSLWGVINRVMGHFSRALGETQQPPPFLPPPPHPRKDQRVTDPVWKTSGHCWAGRRRWHQRPKHELPAGPRPDDPPGRPPHAQAGTGRVALFCASEHGSPQTSAFVT